MTDYYCTIQGICTVDGLWHYAFKSAAGKGAGNASLLEPPTGSSARWDAVRSKTTIGRFGVVLHPTDSPVKFMKMRGKPVAALREDVDADDTIFPLLTAYANAGLALDSVFFVDLETCVMVGVVDDRTIVVERAKGASEATSHARFSGLYVGAPPSWISRRIQIYDGETDTRLMHGYLASEPKSDHHWPSFECLEYLGFREFGARPQLLTLTRADISVATPLETVRVYGASNDRGCYFWLPEPEPGAVIAMAYDPDTEQWSRPANESIVWGRLLDAEYWAGQGYPILLSHADLPYPAFGYEDSQLRYSDNPIDILANLTLSSESGNNYDGGDERIYDLGQRLWPDFALAIPREMVDLASIERARIELAAVRAKWFWLGGRKGETILSCINRLVQPFGYAYGPRADGIWAVIRHGDIYPGDTTFQISNREYVDAGNWQYTGEGRAVDSVVLQCNPGPESDGISTVNNRELTGRQFYPLGIGEVLEFRRMPYDVADFVDSGFDQAVYFAVRFRRLSDRIESIELSHLYLLEETPPLGAACAIETSNPVIWDPTTGERTTQVYARAAGQIFEWYHRTVKAEFWLVDSPGRLGLIAPSAEVVSVDDLEIEVSEADHSEAQDSLLFLGRQVMLLDQSLAPRSCTNGVRIVSVTAVGATSITINQTFQDDGAIDVVPVAGDYIVLAPYGDAQEIEQYDYAYAAPGPVTEDPGLPESTPPYVFGD